MTSDAREPLTEAASPHDTSASRLEVLASIQDLDVRLNQIAHRIEHLPERQMLADVVTEMAALAGRGRELDAEISALERKQRAHEGEVALIEDRRSRNAERLYDSHLTSPKEAEALTAEAASLERRQIEIEDVILELMEQVEPLSSSRSELAERYENATRRRTDTETRIAEAEMNAVEEHDEVLGARTELVASVPAELMALYDERRIAARGEPAVGRLVGMTCSACHLEIPAVDRDRISRLDTDEIVDCPQCGALLVR